MWFYQSHGQWDGVRKLRTAMRGVKRREDGHELRCLMSSWRKICKQQVMCLWFCTMLKRNRSKIIQHHQIKLTSSITEREILVRVSHCFHDFSDGACSFEDSLVIPLTYGRLQDSTVICFCRDVDGRALSSGRIAICKVIPCTLPLGRFAEVDQFPRLFQMMVSMAVDKRVDMDSGQQRLHELGYKQELKRSLSALGNFGMSFSAVAVITGITTTYNTGLAYGGPLSIVYGWLIVSFFTMCVALSMAETCSAYPTSGGLYFWSYKLAGKKWGPFMAWMTGWFNIVGLWAGVSSVDFSLAELLQVVILLSTGGGNGGGYFASKYVVICIHGGLLIVHGLMNSLPINWIAWITSFAVLWNLLGVFVMVISLLAVSPKRQKASFVFNHFNEDNQNGIHSKPYIFLVGLLMSQYTILGYDASAHMSEETKTADKSGAHGIVGAVASSIVLGWGLLLALTFTSRDAAYLLNPSNDAKGYAVAQLFYDAFKERYNDGRWGAIFLVIPVGAVFLCGFISVTSNSRMTYAFSRDGTLPLSNIWHRLNRQEVPLNAVWLCIAIAFCMALPYLASRVAFQAMVSIATIALNVAYVLPTLLRVTIARRSFIPGPFNLGRFGLIIGWLAVGWVATISVLFCLPVAYPVTVKTLNYAPIALGGLLMFTLLYWVFSARHWFKGPVANIMDDVGKDEHGDC